MTYTREGLLLPASELQQPDARLLEAFDEAHLGAQEVYQDLKPSPDQSANAAELWHRGVDANLAVTGIPSEVLKNRYNAMKDLKTRLLNDASIEEGVKQAYRWRINEELANINMLIASEAGRQDLFQRWNEFVYGKPDSTLFHAALDSIAHDAEEILASGAHKSLKSSARNVLSMLDGQRGYRELLSPTDETFNVVRNDHMREQGFYALLLAGIDLPSTGKITQDTGSEIIKHVVTQNLESDYTPSAGTSATWGVSHVNKAIVHPATYNMPVERFMGLGIGHEIGSHLLESVNGSRGPLALASKGLDRVELGNEGRAVIREQVPYQSFEEFKKTVRWRDVLRRYVSIAYAAGTNSPEDLPHGSSATYNFMNAIDVMYQAKLTPDWPSLTLEKASAKTDALLLRVLKGTDGTGGAYLKDKVYLEGNIACWLEAATHGPDIITYGDLGKFDITNPRHIALLQKRGLLPEFVSKVEV